MREDEKKMGIGRVWEGGRGVWGEMKVVKRGNMLIGRNREEHVD